tara:strand:- start:3166 stop:3354 length:189 start_codon:yes stop_codon:yes gene_type:complete
MAKEKACRNCRFVYEGGSKCPKCGGEERSDGFKGKVAVLNPEESEIAKKLELKQKGEYAIKL